MNKFLKFLNKSTEIVFGLASVVYMGLAFLEKDYDKSQHFLILSLLTFIGLKVLRLEYRQENEFRSC